MSILTPEPPQRFDTQVIGPVCVDINIDAEGRASQVVGGAAICAAAAAASLGHEVEAVVSLAKEDTGMLSRLPAPVRHVVAVTSEQTSSIRNVYATADQERRVSTALAQADPISARDIPSHTVSVRHLAGLMVGDYTPDIVEELSARGPLAVDMQGFIRQRDPATGELRFRHLVAGQEFYNRIRFLKVDTAEGEHLTGRSDHHEIARALRDLGACEIMVSNAAEILILDDDGFHACPLRPRSLAGRTGRGDTVFSAYITERASHPVDDALLTACATVSLKMETPGPLNCERADVEDYLSRFYADIRDGAGCQSVLEGVSHGN
ncbi:PfkB family carbohydrate kinase [Actinomyces trachealis]|uniref:PfkB family carbohydrate kinase n=1 Tax=Actinomyces trachealis TaxID=2763540 RepID=UPI0018C475D2|nr:PfkB family carbohydrate kinase [Actinomyces trachealis]